MKIYIIGAGKMGKSIHALMQENGLDVRLIHHTELHSTENNLTVDADFIIETIIEDLEAKKKLFTELEKICPLKCVFTSNTSSLPLDAISHSHRFLGMHFFNPPTVMKLVEVERTVYTSREAEQQAWDLAMRLSKRPIQKRIVNPILFTMLDKACEMFLQQDKGGSTGNHITFETIDLAFRLGLNHKLGPFELMGFIGFDTCEAIFKQFQLKYGVRFIKMFKW